MNNFKVAKHKKRNIIDSDEIIHFIIAEKLGLLTKIFSHRIVVLDIVVEEVTNWLKDNDPKFQVIFSKFLESAKVDRVAFPTDNKEAMDLYMSLSEKCGKGESACLAFASIESDNVLSNNVRDIRESANSLALFYMLTFDLLVLAVEMKVMTEDEGNEFVKKNLEYIPKQKLRYNSLNEYRKRTGVHRIPPI